MFLVMDCCVVGLVFGWSAGCLVWVVDCCCIYCYFVFCCLIARIGLCLLLMY